MDKTVRLAAISAGALYEGEERRGVERHDKICGGLHVAIRILEELRKFAPMWAIWRWAWVPAALRVFRAVVEARCREEESQVSGGSRNPSGAGSSAPPLVDPPVAGEIG